MSNLIKSGLTRLAKFFTFFTGLIFVLNLYRLVVEKHGLVPVMQAGEITPNVLLFCLFSVIPVAIVCFWPVVEKRWPDLYVPTPQIGGIRYLLVITKWRAALLASLTSILLIEVLL